MKFSSRRCNWILVGVTSRTSPESQGGLQVLLPPLLHPTALNVHAIPDVLAAILNSKFEGPNLDMAEW